MDSVYPHSDLSMIICQIGNKEQKLIVPRVNGPVRVDYWATFSLYLADLFLTMHDTDIGNYADGNATYVTADDIDGVIAFLENALNTLFKLCKWFSDNLFKDNADKFHLLFNLKDEVSTNISVFNIVE